MKKSILIKVLTSIKLKTIPPQFNKFCLRKINSVFKKQLPIQLQAGFTLVEMLVVIIIVGILSSIAAPSWINFVNQRRVNVVNDAVLQAIQQARSEAKKNKRDYSVSFKTTNQMPQVAIYISGNTPLWENLAKDSNIKPRQVLLGTNLNTTNTITYGSDTTQTITFDYSGNPSPEPTIIVEVGIPQSNSSNPQVLEPTRRCVKIVSLLGATKTDKGNKCNG